MMKRICTTLAAFIAVFLCLNSYAALVYNFDFEDKGSALSNSGGYEYALPWPEDFANDRIQYIGPCWRRAAGDPYDAISISSKYKATGSYSARFESRTDLANNESNHCPYPWMEKENKARNELAWGFYNVATSPDWGNVEHGDPGQFYTYQFYVPSDEGTYSNWSKLTSPGVIVFQFMAGGNSSTPEAHGILHGSSSGGLKLRIEAIKSVTAQEVQIPLVKQTFDVYPNQWNRLVFWYKRNWDTPGEFKVWLNCSNWSTCEGSPTINISGGMGILDKPNAYFRGGLYRSDGNAANSVVQIMHIDDVNIYDSSTSWSSVVSTFTGDVVTPPPVDQNPEITSINGGSPVASNATEVPFTVNDAANVVVGGYIGASTNPHVPTTWDNITGDSGFFDAGDLSGFTSSPTTLTFFYEPVVLWPSMDPDDWQDPASVSGADYAGSDWVFDSGFTTTTSTAGTRSGIFKDLGYTANVLVGDKMKYTCEYAPDTDEEIYFAIGENATDKRLEARGTAGALTVGTLNGGLGTNTSVTNRALGDGTYRSTIIWTVASGDELNQWKVRAGVYNAQIGDKSHFFKCYLQHNWTTETVSAPLSIGVTDSTDPVISDDSISLSYTGDEDGDGDNSNNYTATYDWTVSELGGQCYLYRSSSATPPSSANLKAGTGADWAAEIATEELTNSIEINGLTYAQYYMHTLCTDSASNDSTIATASNTYAPKQLVFDGTLKRGGVGYNGTADHFKIYDTNPLLDKNAAELIHAEDITITSGSVTIDDDDLTSGSIDLLSPSTDYWFYLFDEDKDPFAFGEIQTTSE